MRVSYLSPGSEDGFFYGPLAGWMRSAAEDLGVELEILHCHRNVARVSAEGRKLLRRDQLPDYLLLANYRHQAVELLPRAEAAGVKVFLINEGLLTADQAKLGGPREKLSLWLGQLVPDDHQCGFVLAERLIAEARKRKMADDDGRIHLCAITGDFSSSSVARVSGLRAALKQHDDVTLAGIHPAGWEKARAGAAMTTQLVTHPQTTVAWAASDLMAAGAVESIRAAGRAPGEDLLVGGVDWAPFAPGMITSGELTASAGGHVLDGAWALIMLYDHHHGRDFGAGTMRSKFVVMTRENLHRYAPLIEGPKGSDADFSRFSRAANPGVTAYEFTPEALFRS